MPDDEMPTPASRTIATAKELLTDMTEGNLIDPRSEDRRRFDAMFYLMKGILFELERIGDQLERPGE